MTMERRKRSLQSHLLLTKGMKDMAENIVKQPVTKGVVKVPVVMQMEALECGAAWLFPLIFALSGITAVQIVSEWIHAVYSKKINGKMAIVGNMTFRRSGDFYRQEKHGYCRLRIQGREEYPENQENYVKDET